MNADGTTAGIVVSVLVHLTRSAPYGFLLSLFPLYQESF